MKTLLLSSLHKVFPNEAPQSEVKDLYGLCNEQISFQLAYRTENDGGEYVYPRVISDIPVKVYAVGYVPLLNTARPGLYPDMLIEKTTNSKRANAVSPWWKMSMEKDEKLLCATDKAWQTLWFTVNEDEKKLKGGAHKITVELYDCKTEKVVSTDTVTVNLSDKALAKQKLMYTNWFHCDCLCDAYGVEMFSEEFWKIFRNFVRAARINGQNMLLLPAFTPPLDTGIGCYRKKAQAVGVKKYGDRYEFDFSVMKRFCDIAREEKIECFEHSHFFTQWGAEAAPAVYAEVDGTEKLIFGWKTKASGKAYRSFLIQYIDALKEFMAKEKLNGKILFHISDEPTPRVIKTFTKAVETVGDRLKGEMCGDALSHFEYYSSGLVKTPIVGIGSIANFVGKCKNLWCYYTGESSPEHSNRLIDGNPSQNRSLGLPLYHYNIKGFLNWGYNYWYGVQSRGFDYPQQNAELFRNGTGGNSIVYPGKDGKAVQSMRQKVFYEGINDIRALKALETEKGRAVSEKLLKKHFGEVNFNTLVNEPEQFISFRKELNELLK